MKKISSAEIILIIVILVILRGCHSCNSENKATVRETGHHSPYWYHCKI